jgi:hypothetical protein|nr:MAG TPA: hypothetical protein [Caudoviricetes sp.]
MEVLRREEYSKETTLFIDYRKFLQDYSEKSYLLKYKKVADTNIISEVYVPKSVVDTEGNIQRWFAEKEGIPCLTIYANAIWELTERIPLSKKIIKELTEDIKVLDGEEKAKAEKKLERTKERLDKHMTKLESTIAEVSKKLIEV